MRVLAMFCAAALAICGTAGAQSSAETVKVHFDRPVVVGNIELPAGDSTIQEIASGGGNVVLLVRSSAGPQAIVAVNRIAAPAGGESTGASVILTHTEDGYRLDRIWLTPVSGFEVLQ